MLLYVLELSLQQLVATVGAAGNLSSEAANKLTSYFFKWLCVELASLFILIDMKIEKCQGAKIYTVYKPVTLSYERSSEI